MAGGAPIGNKNGTKNRPWAAAINRALLAEDGKKLRELAERLINRALDGDIAALKEIGDRVDGKAVAEIVGAEGSDLFPKKIEVSLVRTGT